MSVVALIADIIKSREIPRRSEFQKGLGEKLKTLSGRGNIISPYTITLGDEFQSLYGSTRGVLQDIMEILLFLHPVKLRVSLGIGELNTDINSESALGMDGPAFHMAREGLEELKKTDRSIVQIYDGNGDGDLEFINKGLALTIAEIDNWKYNTLKTFTGLLGGRKINEIYPEINITQRGVYKLIRTNRIENYVDYFQALNDRLRARYGE